MAKIYIGIDPDVTASGICVWSSNEQRILRLCTMPFFDLLDLLQSYKFRPEDETICVIDAGWLNKTNFHSRYHENHRVNAQIGERTGANHETGKKIVEMCEHIGLEHRLHRPTRSKVKAEYFKHLTGYDGRTNQEERDAAMLVFGM